MSAPPPQLRAFTGESVGPSVPLPGVWSFYCDRTIAPHAPLGPVQPVSFSYTSTLADFGTATVVLPVDTVPLTHADLLSFWSWRLWAYYDGVPVWCGCPTGVTDEGQATVTLTMTELTGYLTRRQYDPAGGHVYTQVEQTTIARDLAGPVADVGVAIVTVPGAGFLRDRTYEYLEGDSRADLLSNLAQVLSGPEFRSEYGMDANANPATTLRIAYPRVGSPLSGLGVVVPGGAVGYTGQWDADQFRTHTFAVGDLPDNAPDGAVQPVIVVDRPQAGLPRLDCVDDWPGTVLVSTLRERANTAATIYATPVYQVSASTFVSAPKLTSYGLGDDVTINVRTPLTPDGLITPGRLTSITVTAETGLVDWTVTVTQPPAKPRAGISTRLAVLDARTASTFRTNPQETA